MERDWIFIFPRGVTMPRKPSEWHTTFFPGLPSLCGIRAENVDQRYLFCFQNQGGYSAFRTSYCSTKWLNMEIPKIHLMDIYSNGNNSILKPFFLIFPLPTRVHNLCNLMGEIFIHPRYIIIAAWIKLKIRISKQYLRFRNRLRNVVLCLI